MNANWIRNSAARAAEAAARFVRPVWALIKREFCTHDWTRECCDRYAVVANDGHRTGSVMITIYACKKCGRHTLMISDRQPK